MGGGAVPRPPPTRLPSNLPALQGMGLKAAGATDPSNMGVGRGSLIGPDGTGGKNAFAAAQLAAGGMMPGAPGAGGPGAGMLPGGGGMVASINVYVGKLKAEVDNSLVEELLWCCGRVDKWNRAVDPSTDLPKAFGFCTYRSAQAAAVCVQVREGARARLFFFFFRGAARVRWGNPPVPPVRCAVSSRPARGCLSLRDGKVADFRSPCMPRARCLLGYGVWCRYRVAWRSNGCQ